MFLKIAGLFNDVKQEAEVGTTFALMLKVSSPPLKRFHFLTARWLCLYQHFSKYKTQ